MLFNSFGFIFIFLPMVILVITAARKWVGPLSAQILVLVASIVFYCWFKPTNIFYLAGSIVANWLLARQIAGASGIGRKRWLQLGLFLNIWFLCTFKYINLLLGSLPLLRGHLIPDLDFPLGISFFTLAQIMYLVDCYEDLLPASKLLDHATFVSFFPYIISGPIARAKRMLHQFGHFGGEDGRRNERIARGVYLFSIGLFKKAVIAEAFSRIANYGFDTAKNPSMLEVAVFGLTYSMQIYFDFSGYSDMAIGTAEMLGVEIPRNFDSPYRSLSVIEFWQRWHISLSSFITGYLYTPIQRSFKRHPLFKQRALMTSAFATIMAMAVSGLWHGPAWTFVSWGLLHGIALAINQVWRKKKILLLPRPLCWLITFAFINMTFIFFRSTSVGMAFRLLHGLLNVHHALGMANLIDMHASFSIPVFMPPVLLGLFVAFLRTSSERSAQDFTPKLWTACASGLSLVISCLYMNSQVAASFIYFKF